MNNEIVKMETWLKGKNNLLKEEDKQFAGRLKQISFENKDKISNLENSNKKIENLENILLDKGSSDVDKVYLLMNSKSFNRNALEGYLLFLGQNYELRLASIIASLILKKYGKSSFLDQYIQFLRLNTETDGSVGIINPLRNNINNNDILEWKVQNTYFSLVFFKLYNA